MATTEERLAALEAKMAQLTDTRPTTYYTHQYSGEEIDAATGRALTGGALDTSVTNVSNQLGTFVRPNLLDNWYFGRPVNQRGQTEYTGNVYGVDRWKSGGDTISIVDTGVQIISTGPGRVTQQLISGDLQKSLAGKTVTFSVLADADILDDWRITDTSGFSTSHRDVVFPGNLASWTFTVSDNTNIGGLGVWCESAGKTITLIAAKLELGPTQTLAHREGDKWVLNEVPEYGDQLRRCQRYYLVTSAKHFFSGWATTDNTGFILVPTPTQMRIKPIITVLAGGTFIQNDKTASLTAANFELESADAVGLKIKLNGLNCSTGPFTVADSQIAFSADL